MDFTPRGWEDDAHWQSSDRRQLKRLGVLWVHQMRPPRWALLGVELDVHRGCPAKARDLLGLGVQ